MRPRSRSAPLRLIACERALTHIRCAPMVRRQARAKPMVADDRRRAILDVVIPLLRAKGSSLTTAEIARAANIAEGTIFRVFPDKSAVMFEALKAAMDATPVALAIRAIRADAPLRAQ